MLPRRRPLVPGAPRPEPGRARRARGRHPTFNRIAFSGEVRPWKRQPRIRSGKTAAKALLWVEKMPAAGGTNIGDALEAAFERMGAGLQKERAEALAYDTVFFVTDGTPSVAKMTETWQVLAAVRRWNEGRRCACTYFVHAVVTRSPTWANTSCATTGARAGGRRRARLPRSPSSLGLGARAEEIAWEAGPPCEVARRGSPTSASTRLTRRTCPCGRHPK